MKLTSNYLYGELIIRHSLSLKRLAIMPNVTINYKETCSLFIMYLFSVQGGVCPYSNTWHKITSNDRKLGATHEWYQVNFEYRSGLS